MEASGSPGGSSFGHFLMACWNIKLEPNEPLRRHYRNRAQVRIWFDRFDMDGDGFLNMVQPIGEWTDSKETGTLLPTEWEMFVNTVIKTKGVARLPDGTSKETLRRIAENIGATNDNLIGIEEAIEVWTLAAKGARGTAMH